jgi:hypothetical protein
MKHILLILSTIGSFLALSSSVEATHLISEESSQKSMSTEHLIKLKCDFNLLKKDGEKKIKHSINENLITINQIINNPENNKEDTNQICDIASNMRSLNITNLHFLSSCNNSLEQKRLQNEVKPEKNLWESQTFPQRELISQVNSLEFYYSYLAELLNKYLYNSDLAKHNPEDNYSDQILTIKSRIGDTIRAIKELLPKIDEK